MRFCTAVLVLTAGLASAHAQTLPSLPDLASLGGGTIANPLAQLPDVIHPAELPLGIPVVCIGSCGEAVATVCRIGGYPASSASPLRNPLGTGDVLASGVCSKPK